MTVLVLGDCIGNGQNCLWGKICNKKGIVLPSNFKRQIDLEKKLLQWFHKNNKSTNKKFSTLVNDAYSFLNQQEKLVAWPAQLSKDSVNLTTNGETFITMFVKLKIFLQNNNKPNFIVITDFDRGHYSAVVNDKQKVVMKRDIALLDNEQNWYDASMYEIFKKKVRTQHSKGYNFWLRKNYKEYQLLTKFIEQQNIAYKTFSFMGYIPQLKNSVDLVHLTKKWMLSDHTVDVDKKFDVQKETADLIRPYITSITTT